MLKIEFYYQKALSIPTLDFPCERAITFFNFLSVSWHVSNRSANFNHERFDDILLKAQEIKSQVDDPQMVSESERHLEMLQELKRNVRY